MTKKKNNEVTGAAAGAAPVSTAAETPAPEKILTPTAAAIAEKSKVIYANTKQSTMKMAAEAEKAVRAFDFAGLMNMLRDPEKEMPGFVKANDYTFAILAGVGMFILRFICRLVYLGKYAYEPGFFTFVGQLPLSLMYCAAVIIVAAGVVYLFGGKDGQKPAFVECVTVGGLFALFQIPYLLVYLIVLITGSSFILSAVMTGITLAGGVCMFFGVKAVTGEMKGKISAVYIAALCIMASSLVSGLIAMI